jgi:translocation and assembly module TamB
VCTLLVFVMSLVGGVLLHLGTPPVRRSVVQHVNAILAPLFKGKIHIDRLGGLSLRGISASDVTISDPSGKPVIVARGVRAEIATFTTVRSILFGKNAPMDIRLYGVSIDRAEVRLDTDANGSLDLVDAFASATPPSPTPSAPGRGVQVEIPNIALGHVWVHGVVPGAPPLDADVDDVAAEFDLTPDVVEGDVNKATVLARKIANGADVAGVVHGHGALPFASDATPTLQVAWRGAVAGIAHTIDASMANGKVDAVVDVPRATPDQIRALWPASTFDQSATAHVEAHGALAHIDVAIRAGLGPAGVDVKGTVAFADEKSAKLSIVAHDIDVRELAPSAPASRLGLDGEVTADLSPDNGAAATASLQFRGGSIGGARLPPATIRARGSRSPDGAMDADLDLLVDEPGAPTHLFAHMTPQRRMTFELDSAVADLDRVAEMPHVAHGGVKLRAKGSVDLTTMTIDAEAHAQATRVLQGKTTVEAAALDVTAHGRLTEPRIDATLQVDGIVAAGLRFATARAHAEGALFAPHVDLYARGADTPDIDASADLGLKNGILLADLRLVLARAGEKGVVTAARVAIASGDVHVDDARITGLGDDATAAVTLTPSELLLRASTRGLDLGRIARLANIQKTLQGGTLAFDADVELERGAARGRVSLSIDHAKVQSFTGIAAKVDATLDGRKVVAKVHAEASDVATLDLDAPAVEIGGGGALSARSWRAAWGSVSIDAKADLAKLSKLIPPEQSPVDEAGGTVTIRGHVERDDLQDYTPDVALDVTTQNFSVTPKTARQLHYDRVLVMEPASWTIAGIDVQMHVVIDGKSGRMKLDTVLLDEKGELGELHADSAHIPYEDVFNDTGSFARDLRTTAFDVTFSTPERDLAGLPSILQQGYVAGRVKTNITAKGTLLAPNVVVAASVVKARGEWVRAPIDFDIAAHYDGAKGGASVKAASRGRALLDEETTFDAAIADILAADGDLPWSASAKAHLDSFPLQSLTILNDKLVKGLVSGDVSLDGLHRDAHAKADLTIASLTLGTVGYKGGELHASADGKAIDGSLRVDQTDGFVEAKAHASATWGAALLPTLDPAQPLTASLSSKNFRLVALQPMLDGVFDEFDGRLDSNATVELDPKVRGAKLAGNIALRRGTIEAVAGGGEFHDITGNLRFAPDGTITLEKLTGEGLTGRFDATGVGHVNGTTLQSAKVSINIPHNASIPISAGGSEIGNVDGQLELTETGSANGAMKFAIGVPKWRVSLPQGTTTNAISLGPIAKVSIGSHRGTPMTFVVIPIDPAVPVAKADAAGAEDLTIQVNLGDVQVVRGSEIRVGLTGKLAIDVGPTTTVTGQIRLQPGGTLTEQGKTFIVESGTVTFVGDDPSNPEVVVQASWTAPEGTVVFANFVGPLKTGKVTLRSEPALPRDEIVQLLLFGAADGQSAQSQAESSASGGGTETTAAVAAGGQAAAPLNHALGQIGLGAVTAKIDTSETNPKPEVEVQIANDLSLQIAVVLGVPPPGVNPDRTLFTLDWRFASKWSLASTVGDAGTTVFDMLWKKRY